MSTVLSPKQEETAEVIYKLTYQNNYPPTLDEIASEMGITKGTLQYHMTALRKKGAIDWNTGSARSVQIIDQEVAEGGSQPVQVMLQCNYAVGEKLDVHLVLAAGPRQHHWLGDLCPHGNCCRLNR